MRRERRRKEEEGEESARCEKSLDGSSVVLMYKIVMM